MRLNVTARERGSSERQQTEPTLRPNQSRLLVEAQEEIQALCDRLAEAGQHHAELLGRLAFRLRDPLAAIGASLRLLDGVHPDSESARQARTSMSRQMARLTLLADDLREVVRGVEEDSAAKRAAVEVNRQRVLIIEDSVDTAESLREALAFGNCEIVVSYDGPQGIAKAREFRPEVVLCDIGLPGMNGFDVARAFRSDEVLKHTHLVALSGYVMPYDRQRSSEAGFEKHLAKPPDLGIIERLLAEMRA